MKQPIKYIGDIIIETYIKSNVAIPAGKVMEKSGNSMWSESGHPENCCQNFF